MVFWILTTPRSGSNYIAGEIWRRLGGEPKPMEYFNAESVASRSDFTPDPAAPVRSYLDYLMARESLGGVLGVKMLWGQVQACSIYSDFLAELTGRKIVHLRRRDTIRQGISFFIMRQTGAWASSVAPRRLQLDEIAYDYDAIAASVARMEVHNAQLERFLDKFGLHHFTVCYEDFTVAPDSEADRILSYLGLEKSVAPPQMAERFTRQSTGLNEEFRERFLTDERTRLHSDGIFRGSPPCLTRARETCTWHDD